MKRFTIILCFIIGATHTCLAQTGTVDTVTTVDFGKMPPVYSSNKVYWEKNYDDKNHLLFEALKYKSCFIGPFISYSENGKLKMTGQYVQNNSGKWEDLQSRGFCSVHEGEWKSFDQNGKRTKTVVYKGGKIVKEY